MAFVTGTSCSSTNPPLPTNAGAAAGARTDNTVAVKAIGRAAYTYPYVSAQAFRYWLRTGLEEMTDTGWQSSPIFRENKVADTDANPFVTGMTIYLAICAHHRVKKRLKRRAQLISRASETPLTEGVTLTRAAPFRVGTLVSIAPVAITDDFGKPRPA